MFVWSGVQLTLMCLEDLTWWIHCLLLLLEKYISSPLKLFRTVSKCYSLFDLEWSFCDLWFGLISIFLDISGRSHAMNPHKGLISDNEIACRAWPRITPQTKMFVTFGPNISEFFDLCLHLGSVASDDIK